MVVWPPLCLKNAESAVFQNKSSDPSFEPKFNADQEYSNNYGSQMYSNKGNWKKQSLMTMFQNI